MGIFKQFCEIFTQMNWIPAVLLGVGLVFIIVEVFVPGFGFFGITGTLSVVAGITVRIVHGLNVAQSVMLVLLVVIVFVVLGFFMVYSAQHGMLGRTGLFENKSSIPKDYDKPEKAMRKLVGKSGKTVSPLKPGGKAKIAGKVYDVISINSYVESGAHIKVVDVKDNTIRVRKWFE